MTVSDLQSNIVVDSAHSRITGTLYEQTGAEDEDENGYFLALHFDDITAAVTSLYAGVVPSSDGLTDILSIGNGNAVFKIEDKNNQLFRIIVGTAGGFESVEYDLSRLTLATE